MASGIKSLTFNEEAYPDVLGVVNELAGLENRRPHDSARLLILEAGKAKIASLKQQLGIHDVNSPSGDSSNPTKQD